MGGAQGTARPFPLWRLLAAHGHRPSINVRISPPEHMHTIPTVTKFRFLAAARVPRRVMTLLALNFAGAGLDRLRSVSARHRRP